MVSLQEKVNGRIEYLKEAETLWYIPEENIDKVNSLGAVLFVGGHITEPSLENFCDWLPKLERTRKSYGSIAVFFEGDKPQVALVYLGKGNFFTKWGINEEIGFTNELELTRSYGSNIRYFKNKL